MATRANNPGRPKSARQANFAEWGDTSELGTVIMDGAADPAGRCDRGEGEPSCRDLIVVRPDASPAPQRVKVPTAAATIPTSELLAAQARHAAELADLRRQLLEARKQASIGELLGTTTHEFNNALTTILNYARMGIRHRDQPTRDKALERILSAGTRAAKITASVLSMSRNRSSRFEPTDLLTLIEDVLVLLEREMMKYRVQVEREFAAVPRDSANPSQLPQVLLNLKVPEKRPLASLPLASAAMADVETKLGKDGRILVRYSGTEAKIRVMIEGPDEAIIGTFAQEVVAAISKDFGV